MKAVVNGVELDLGAPIYYPVRGQVVKDAATNRVFIWGPQVQHDFYLERIDLRAKENQTDDLWVCPWVAYTQQATIANNEILIMPNERLIGGDGYFMGNGYGANVPYQIEKIYGEGTYIVFECWNKDTANDLDLDALLLYRRINSYG